MRAWMIAVALACSASAARALPETYFPAGTTEPVTSEGWRALQERFPLLVKGTDTTFATPAASGTIEIKPGLAYFRIRSLARDLEALTKALSNPALIIDLRFVTTSETESLQFAGLLAREETTLELSGGSTPEKINIAPAAVNAGHARIIVLINARTSGPIEAALAALRDAGDIMLVGETTNGSAARFVPVERHAQWSVIAGDFRASNGEKILGRGVAPDLPVAVTALEDETAYHALDNGVSIAALLDATVEKARFDESLLLRQHVRNGTRAPPPVVERPDPPASDQPAAPKPGNAKEKEGPPPPFDKILHRGVNTIVALRALRLLPDVK